LKKWTTPDSRNTPSTTNLDEEENVDALGNDCNASMPEQVTRRNPWRKMMMIMMMMMIIAGQFLIYLFFWFNSFLQFKYLFSCILFSVIQFFIFLSLSSPSYSLQM